MYVFESNLHNLLSPRAALAFAARAPYLQDIQIHDDMNNCKEFILDVMTIAAIPFKEADDDNISYIVNQLTPYIKGLTPSLDGAVVFGLTAPDSATLVPIKRMTGKAKDDEGDSVAGRLHTVTASCEVDERGGEIWADLAIGVPCSLSLERNAHHLLLTFRDGSQGFVAANTDCYQCNVERDGAKVTVQFRIQNLMGIQRLLPSTT